MARSARGGRGFNSRTHAGCDGKRESATYLIICFNSRTHAGCDHAGHSPDPIQLSFNSRTHAGCDIYCNNIPYIYIAVSIHAPTRGATSSKKRCSNLNRSFNSRTHAGCDLILTIKITWNYEFQFTHPRGVRHVGIIQHPDEVSFNSRTHAGCDFDFITFAVFALGFNSRTHAGCDS